MANAAAVDTDLVGIGLYSVSEAARLLRVNTNRARRWVDGYTYRARGVERTSAPVIQRDLPREDRTDVLTFLDLMELYFVDIFSRQGVRMRVIRDAAKVAAELFNTQHPFAVATFQTDGHRIFATPSDRDEEVRAIIGTARMIELAPAQWVFEEFARPFCEDIEYGPKEALKYWPLGKTKRVVLDPRRAFGKPIDAETGVSTFVLYQASKSGEALPDIADWYDVPEEAVLQAVQYERYLLLPGDQ